MPTKNIKFRALSSLRFFAALMIFLHHLDVLKGFPQYSSFYLVYLHQGYTAVTFFFVVSGFVLMHQYFDTFSKGEFSVLPFLKKRILRLIPLHEFTLLLSIPLSITTASDIHLPVFLATVFMIHGFFPAWDYLFSYNKVSWTLSAFLCCYLCFTPFMGLVKTLRINSVVKIFISIGILWLAYYAMITYINFGEGTYFALYILPNSRLFEFATGMLLLLLVHRMLEKMTKVPLFFGTILEVTTLILFYWTYTIQAPVPNNYLWSFYYLPIMSLMVIVFSYGKGYITNFLSNRILVAFGEASFEFYLFHWIILQVFIRFLWPAFSLGPIVTSVLAFLTTLIAALVFHSILEKVLKKKPRNDKNFIGGR